jgi:hypothetical protein
MLHHVFFKRGEATVKDPLPITMIKASGIALLMALPRAAELLRPRLTRQRKRERKQQLTVKVKEMSKWMCEFDMK